MSVTTKKILMAISIGMLLSSCGIGKFLGANGADQAVKKPIAQWSAEEIFKRGDFDLNKGDPSEAAKWFGEVERLYPASDEAPQALYIKALSYYDQLSEVGRDLGLISQATAALQELVQRYPNSEYAKSAQLKLDLSFDYLASKEMDVGRYYLKRKNYAAAANRFRVVVEEYQTTTHVPEALHRLSEAYLSLGLPDEAQTAGAILGYNYRGSEWYKNSYDLLTKNGLEPKAKGRSWLSSAYRQVVKGEWL